MKQRLNQIETAKSAILFFAVAMFLVAAVARAKTFDIGAGTLELPDDFAAVYSAAHEPFSHGFSSQRRGLFIGWIMDGRSDAPLEKRIERPISQATGRSNGLSYRLSIRKIWKTRLVIVFPDTRTSFWSDVTSQKDLDTVKSLILTFKLNKHR